MSARVCQSVPVLLRVRVERVTRPCVRSASSLQETCSSHLSNHRDAHTSQYSMNVVQSAAEAAAAALGGGEGSACVARNFEFILCTCASKHETKGNVARGKGGKCKGDERGEARSRHWESNVSRRVCSHQVQPPAHHRSTFCAVMYLLVRKGGRTTL